MLSVRHSLEGGSQLSVFNLQLRGSKRAFSLLEVTLAVGIAGFCLLAIVGMLPLGLSNNLSSIHQAAAASLTGGIIADLRSTPKTTNASPRYGVPFSTGTARWSASFSDDGTPSTTASAPYLATVAINLDANLLAAVNVKITWPAAVSANKALEAFEITTAIDRR